MVIYKVMNAFFYPSKRGINFAKIRGFKVTDYSSILTSAELTTVAIAHNMKKMISVMHAERAKAFASEGRATRGT